MTIGVDGCVKFGVDTSEGIPDTVPDQRALNEALRASILLRPRMSERLALMLVLCDELDD
jgi:hypothetical protein